MSTFNIFLDLENKTAAFEKLLDINIPISPWVISNSFGSLENAMEVK